MWMRSSILFLFFAMTQSLIPMIWRSLHPPPVCDNQGHNTLYLRTTKSSTSSSHGKYFSGSASSFDAVDRLQELAWEIETVKRCLKNDTSPPPPEIQNYLPIYDGGDKTWLRDMLRELQVKETKLLPSQLPVESEGKCMNVVKYDWPAVTCDIYFLHRSVNMIPFVSYCYSDANGNSMGCSSRFGHTC